MFEYDGREKRETLSLSLSLASVFENVGSAIRQEEKEKEKTRESKCAT